MTRPSLIPSCALASPTFRAATAKQAAIKFQKKLLSMKFDAGRASNVCGRLQRLDGRVIACHFLVVRRMCNICRYRANVNRAKTFCVGLRPCEQLGGHRLSFADGCSSGRWSELRDFGFTGARFDMTACLARSSSPLETTTHSAVRRDSQFDAAGAELAGVFASHLISAPALKHLWGRFDVL